MNEKNNDNFSQFFSDNDAYKSYASGDLLTISELVAVMRHKNLEVTSQQVKKYEDFGLMHPADKTDANYRLYSKENVEQLDIILTLRLIQVPLKKIKRYFELISEVKSFTDKYFEVKENFLVYDSKSYDIFSDEDKANLDAHLEKNINREKIASSVKEGKEYLNNILNKLNELSLMMIEFYKKWRRLGEASELYEPQYTQKALNVEIIAKEVERLLGVR